LHASFFERFCTNSFGGQKKSSPASPISVEKSRNPIRLVPDISSKCHAVYFDSGLFSKNMKNGGEKLEPEKIGWKSNLMNIIK